MSHSINGWHSRGYLPHFDGSATIQFVTVHLADSLPGEAIERMRQQLDSLPEDEKKIQQRQRIQDLLDAGRGSCVLQRNDCADIVQQSLLFGDSSRYRLLHWVIMPNHVHVIIQQMDVSLPKIVQSWKRHTSREIHRMLAIAENDSDFPALWQRDYWDRFIRDEQHYYNTAQYIDQNPVKSGLVSDAQSWPWGSAGWDRLHTAEYNSAIPGR